MDIRPSTWARCEADHALSEYRRRPHDRAHRLLCPRCDAEEIAVFENECAVRDQAERLPRPTIHPLTELIVNYLARDEYGIASRTIDIADVSVVNERAAIVTLVDGRRFTLEIAEKESVR